MAKKRPFVLIISVMLAFGLIALFNSSMTGYSVYGKLSSILSGNALSTMGAPLVVLTVIFGISIVALRNTTKE